jgi:hypothetical protein
MYPTVIYRSSLSDVLPPAYPRGSGGGAPSASSPLRECERERESERERGREGERERLNVGNSEKVGIESNRK